MGIGGVGGRGPRTSGLFSVGRAAQSGYACVYNYWLHWPNSDTAVLCMSSHCNQYVVNWQYSV